MRIAIIGNGNFIACAEQLRTYDLVLAADGGANHCARLGITPQHIIGDLDSLATEQRTQKNVQANVGQNTTDLQKVLRYIQTELRPSNYTIDLFCVTSADRLDHTLMALWLLQCEPTVATIFTPWQSLRLVRDRYQFTAARGTRFALLPLSTQAAVNITGAKWSGQNIILDQQQAGISNVIHDSLVTITVMTGAVFCIIDITWTSHLN